MKNRAFFIFIELKHTIYRGVELLEWKTITLGERKFIGMYLALPKHQIYIISSTKSILVGTLFNIDKFAPTINVFIMRESKSFNDLLNSEVIMMNGGDLAIGYQIGMKGKEVLLYQVMQM